MSWQRSPKAKNGGYWRCLIKRREASIRRNRRQGMAPAGSEQHHENVVRSNYYNKVAGRNGPSNHPSTIHNWLPSVLPKTGICDECGTDVGTTRPGGTEYAFLLHPEPHTRNPNDYREMCPSCHRALDEKFRRILP